MGEGGHRPSTQNFILVVFYKYNAGLVIIFLFEKPHFTVNENVFTLLVFVISLVFVTITTLLGRRMHN